MRCVRCFDENETSLAKKVSSVVEIAREEIYTGLTGQTLEHFRRNVIYDQYIQGGATTAEVDTAVFSYENLAMKGGHARLFIKHMEDNNAIDEKEAKRYRELLEDDQEPTDYGLYGLLDEYYANTIILDNGDLASVPVSGFQVFRKEGEEDQRSKHFDFLEQCARFNKLYTAEDYQGAIDLFMNKLWKGYIKKDTNYHIKIRPYCYKQFEKMTKNVENRSGRQDDDISSVPNNAFFANAAHSSGSSFSSFSC
mmetsp:Transcript_4509/g.6502  ORF Transcript_4509/g.6502 Transcript_4509/m.6502 type:complete len:252 (-) Transcript_4509:41-796(-)